MSGILYTYFIEAPIIEEFRGVEGEGVDLSAPPPPDPHRTTSLMPIVARMGDGDFFYT